MKAEKECSIIGIDHEHSTIYLSVNGINVTAICSQKANDTAYRTIQSVLIDTILKPGATTAS